MGNTGDLFQTIRDFKRILHAKMSIIKDRKCKDLAEAKRDQKRWQEYTEELYTNYLNGLDCHSSVVTQLETNILGCGVKWTLESIKMNKLVEETEFQLSYFKSKKMVM